MASLLSSWSSNLESLPENYVVPVEKREGMLAPISKDIPVIDLGGPDRADIVQKIIKASQEFGLFQVVNHGVSEKLMIDAVNVGKEFFSMPAEVVEKFASQDAVSGRKVYTGSGSYRHHDFELWKDTLQHLCHPLEKCIDSWPDKPAQYREIIGPYSVEVRKLGIRVLDLIYEGLGILTEEKIDNYELLMTIHNYPVCPDPTSALGLAGHQDGNLITIVQQDVYGLQLLKDGQWLGVEPLPNGFVINICFLLEVISNGKLKSMIHRVVTNSACSRTSIANFVSFSFDWIVEPAKSLVSPSNPPAFRSFRIKEYLEVLVSNKIDSEATAEYFKIRSHASK